MVDVLVVGAGPVGLVMAAELRRHGASVRIIDKAAEPLPFCRAIGVTPRTLEVYEQMGIVRPMIEAGVWLEGVRVEVNGSARTPHVDLSDLPYGALGIPQPQTERILTAHLASLGVKAERGLGLRVTGAGRGERTGDAGRRGRRVWRRSKSLMSLAAMVLTARCAAHSASPSKVRRFLIPSCWATYMCNGRPKRNCPVATRCAPCWWKGTSRRTFSLPFPCPSMGATA